MDSFFDFSKMIFKDDDPDMPETKKKPSYNDCIDDMPLTMAYVPMQKTLKMYDPEAGLQKGTIFPILDKPFYECSKRWRDAR